MNLRIETRKVRSGDWIWVVSDLRSKEWLAAGVGHVSKVKAEEAAADWISANVLGKAA